MKNKSNKGFTLAELLVVIAIIGVLIGVAIPVFKAQTEKAKNAVDMHNAKIIADCITLYFMSDPDAFEELQQQCDAPKSQHCVQVEVISNTTIAPVLQKALFEAGLIKSMNTSSAARFMDFTCKSEENWAGYRIVVSNYNTKNPGEPGELQIYFWGLPKGTTAHSSNSLGQYVKTDVTGFQDAMEGRS